MSLQKALEEPLTKSLLAKASGVKAADVRPSSDLYLALNPGQLPAHFGFERKLTTLRPVFEEVSAAAWSAINVPSKFTGLVAEQGDLLYSTIRMLSGRIASLLELSVRYLAAVTAATAAAVPFAQVKPGTKLAPVGSAERDLFIKRLQASLLEQLGKQRGPLGSKESAKLRSAVTFGDAITVLAVKYLKVMEESQ